MQKPRNNVTNNRRNDFSLLPEKFGECDRDEQNSLVGDAPTRFPILQKSSLTCRENDIHQTRYPLLSTIRLFIL